MPPYLAGRRGEIDEFVRLLGQDVILENMVLTGLRGVGKTVLLDTCKPLAIERGWAWVGADLSEATSIAEERIVLRLMTDLAVVTSSIRLQSEEVLGMGFRPEKARRDRYLDFDCMLELFKETPGLVSDKLKAVLEFVWQDMKRQQPGGAGLVFAYDEAQNLSDHAARDQYPLSLVLDVFQSIQRKGIPFMLVLAGLPTLFPKLVEARTFAERMFRVVFLDRLSAEDSREAILQPLSDPLCPIKMGEDLLQAIVNHSGGYPYFIQFISREAVDVLARAGEIGQASARVPISGIIRKLDTDFFAGRWARTTDRQRQLLTAIANLPDCESEFGVQEIVEKSRQLLQRPIGASQVSQMLTVLSNAGLVYKNRHGKYSFAVPLLGRFIMRQQEQIDSYHSDEKSGTGI